MPFTDVFKKFRKGALHSGSQSGPVVSNPQQAKAIFMSEKSKAAAGNQEYQAPAAPAPPSKHPIHKLKMPKNFRAGA
jgi:hypothetical protein